MSIDFAALKSAPRILIEAALQPVQGKRFQPTGFPDLGPALYDAPDGNGGVIPTLLIESAQSMANRLEAVCWDEGNNTIAEALKGLPYVLVKLAGLGDGTDTTTSLQEFHRLNSPYIMSGTLGDKSFADVLKPQLGMSTVAGKPKKEKKGAAAESIAEVPSAEAEKEPDDVAGVVNLRKLAAVCFKYDPNSLIHGIFLEKIAGRLRHPRALSAFIEASGVGRADSGGVKFDRVLPKPSVAGVDAKGGYGNVPFHRTEFTAQSITAYFSIDLAQIRGYGLPDDATNLLIALSLWKVRQFLDSNMRLRTACELELVNGSSSIVVKRPDKFVFPESTAFGNSIATLIGKCQELFAKPIVTELTWSNSK
ncbi:MAG: type I-U CRISPR-associated RAMP protein Csb1/Cas7u [Planctomycetia bacterium]|nr:type I-U CRISPR-associated RAMP protein Csb1/Cas7u [Planctomycetia bacterium]